MDDQEGWLILGQLFDVSCDVSVGNEKHGVGVVMYRHREVVDVVDSVGVGDCEAELDEALGAARQAGDDRRVTAVLGSAPVAVRWPLMRSTSCGSIPPSAIACRMHRRTLTGLGAVMLPPLRCPPQLRAPPRTSA